MKDHRTTGERIREIAKLPNIPMMSDDLIVGLSELCFYSSPITLSDVLFVFGSNILHQEIGGKIADLLAKFDIPTVIITGGIADYNSSFYEPIAESELIYSHIARRNFPKTQFIIEKNSKNTLENVGKVNDVFDLGDVDKILFFSHSYASMRSYLSLKKYCKKASFGNYQINVPSDIPDTHVDVDNWFKTEYGRKLV